MGYKTILTYLANEKQAPQAMAAASLLAQRSNAHLTGLYVIPAMRLYVASPYGGVDVTAKLMEQHRAWHEAESAKVRAQFDKAMAGATHPGEWFLADTLHVDPLETIMAHGRNCELIVATQDDPKREDVADERIAERLMMEAGRPVLLVPAGAPVTTIGTDITVGWNGSRESARAVFDALPLLKAARMVHIVWVDPRVETDESPSRAADALAASLAHHGVTCEAVEAASQDHTVGDELLARVADYGSDLLVMGGYGQSRFRELVFGGVTRKVLGSVPVPVLMSH
ncbi:MAG: universal stress protein [Alphaproteobacteria bacterium]